MDWVAPRNVCDVQYFLGFVNFYWRFIQGFSKVVTLITWLLWKNSIFASTQEAQSTFDQLKKVFTSARNLVHLDPAKPFVVEADASNYVTKSSMVTATWAPGYASSLCILILETDAHGAKL